MNKKKIIIIVIFAAVFFATSLFLYIKSEGGVENEEEINGRTYRNETYGYTMIYPYEWEVREKDEQSYFHSVFARESLPDMGVDWNTYQQDFALNLEGRSPLTYIDGSVNYNIEKHIYPNSNNFTILQWHGIAALTESLSAQKISESTFVRIIREVLDGRDITTETEGIFDPWMSRGNIVTIGERDVLKFTKIGDHQYDGYQYYVTEFDDYFFVFRFGFGGPVIPREMWSRSDRHIKEMIASFEKL